MWSRKREVPAVTIDEIRKRANLLVIDDKPFPAEILFRRDGYHIERWAKVRNVSQLTNGDFDLILLDLHGVGLAESPQRQGLGILEHIKESNPTQLVLAYSAEKWNISNRDYFDLADEVMIKGSDYLEFKASVERLLSRRYTQGYFIAKMNQVLGDSAADAPKAVPTALKALRKDSTGGLARYLGNNIQNEKKVDLAVTVISTAIKVLGEIV